jgi:hypothetical protein
VETWQRLVGKKAAPESQGESTPEHLIPLTSVRCLLSFMRIEDRLAMLLIHAETDSLTRQLR